MAHGAVGRGFGFLSRSEREADVASAPLERAASAGGPVSTNALQGKRSARRCSRLARNEPGKWPHIRFVCAGLAVVAGLCSISRLAVDAAEAGARRHAASLGTIAKRTDQVLYVSRCPSADAELYCEPRG